MKKFKLIYCFVLILACAFKLSAQDIQATARLDSGTMKIGAQTKLHLSVHQPVKAHVSFPQIADTLIEKVQVLSATKTDTIFDKDRQNITVHKAYNITAFDEGTYTIPSFAFHLDSAVVNTNQLTLVVQTVKVDTTKAIYDIKQPMAVSYTLWDWLRDHWVIVCIVLGVLLLIGGIIWYIKTRPKKEVVVEKVIPIIPIDVIAINKLKELRDKKVWQQDIKLYHSEVSDIIREYMEKRYIIKTHEKTTDEIFTAIKFLDIDQEARNLLRQILLLADLVKFAKEKPLPAENEQSLDNAIAFVSKTRQIMTTPKPEGGGNDAHV